MQVLEIDQSTADPPKFQKKCYVVHHSDSMSRADAFDIFGSESPIPAAKNICLARDRRLQHEIIIRITDHRRKRLRQVDRSARVLQKKYILRDHAGR